MGYYVILSHVKKKKLSLLIGSGSGGLKRWVSGVSFVGPFLFRLGCWTVLHVFANIGI
jgi:hypothetical protein